MQFDQQQLAAIGTEHFRERLIAWQLHHLKRTSFNRGEFTTLLTEANRLGLFSQRGIAAWSLVRLLDPTQPTSIEPSIERWLGIPSIDARERTVLLEIWLCLQTPSALNGSSLTAGDEHSPLSAELVSCLSNGRNAARSRRALREASKLLRLISAGLAQPLGKSLAALRADLNGQHRTLVQSFQALEDCVGPLLQGLNDALLVFPEPPAESVAQPVAAAPPPVPDQAIAAPEPAMQRLELFWQEASSQVRHVLPRLLEALQAQIETGQEQAPLAALPSLERSHRELARIAKRLNALPRVCAGALGCARLACLAKAGGSLAELEGLKARLLAKHEPVDGQSLPWYSALAALPEDFQLLRASNPIQPLDFHERSLNALDTALAQLILFNARQALEVILMPNLDLAEPEAGPTTGSRRSVASVATFLGERMAALDMRIAELDRGDSPSQPTLPCLEEISNALGELLNSDASEGPQADICPELASSAILTRDYLLESADTLAALFAG